MSIDLSKRACASAESQTLRIAHRAKQMKQQGIDVVSLSTGEPDFNTPDCAKRAATEAIATNFTHYTDVNGIYELRAAVAEKFRIENHIESATPETVLITTGAKQALMNALGAICNEGDEVIILAPYWVSYPAMVTLCGATPVIISAGIDQHFKITPEQLSAALTDKTKCVIINSPNNPTGSMYSREELSALADVLSTHSCYILSDEIYEKISYGEVGHWSIGSLPQVAGRVLTVNGVSKAYAMTGWRVGFLHAPKSVMTEASKVQGQTTSHPSSIAQIASLSAVLYAAEDVENMREAFVRRRELICNLLDEIPLVRYMKPDGAFYVFVDVSATLGGKITDSAGLCEVLLEKYHLALVPGEAFGADGYVRISFAASEDTIYKALDRFKHGIADILTEK
jgi:aspartate aminotransferase